MNNIRIRTAFILGAGLGMRLRPLTDNLPKPLLPVGGRPLVTYAMDHCRTLGIERFIVNIHHCAEAYTRAFPREIWQGTPILLRHEPVLLDTAGGIKNIEDLLDPDESILVYNGDILSDLPLERLLAAHAAGGREVTLALRSDGPLRNVCLDAKGEICDLRDLIGNPGIRRCLFTGIYIVEKRFLRRLEPGKIESVVPVFAEMIRQTPGSVASVVIDEGEWRDVGDTEAYLRIRAVVPTLRYEKGSTTAAVSRRGEWEKEANAFIRETLGIAAGTQVDLLPVGKGGSDRDFFRVAAAGTAPVILMHYGRMYAENDLYAGIDSFLQGVGVRVPAIYGHDTERRVILMEDLGDTDLYALRGAPWEVRRPLYEKVLALAVKMHAFSPDRLPEGLCLMPGFDAALYRWERNYFREECVRNGCRINLDAAEDGSLETELSTLAGRLLLTAPVLVHRDLQSQNVMILDGKPILIDFQGMRPGSPFYDLGSLLYDPYVSFPKGGREALLRIYHEASGALYPWEEFRELFLMASAQRLMQTLGAYGFLGLKRGKRHFLAHIGPALENLIAVTAETGTLSHLNALARRCRDTVLAKASADGSGGAPERVTG
jgi:NDP-sugar pyrophosphorylase family protein/aminoglycoside/choline kinase family phosphotransferase